MNELLQIITELGIELHPDRISAVASKLEEIVSNDDIALVMPSFGPNLSTDILDRLRLTWSKHKEVSPKEVASALRGAAAAAKISEKSGKVELVWSGPDTGLVPVRHTEQVLCELIGFSRRRLFLVSFVAYSVSSIMQALKDAVDRQVQIDLLLESSEKYGGRVSHDSVGTIMKALPSISIYVWDSDSKTPSGQLPGAVHAKCAVADGKLAFITSANLTSAAMESNMELGLLIRQGDLPFGLERHLDALIQTKVITKVH